jgi:hypothetical protein
MEPLQKKVKVEPGSSSSSSSSSDAAEAARFRTQVKETKGDLACCICFEINIAPLYQCRHGHVIPCSDCRRNLKFKECFECRSPCNKEALSRCRILEKSAADIHVECKRGCGGSCAYSGLAEHDEDCVGKVPVKCITDGCQYESKLWSTAIEHHKSVSEADSILHVYF